MNLLYFLLSRPIGPVRPPLVESGGTSTTPRYMDSGDDYKLWRDIELTTAVAETLQSTGKKSFFLKESSVSVLL